jgi:hypothetical protein
MAYTGVVITIRRSDLGDLTTGFVVAEWKTMNTLSRAGRVTIDGVWIGGCIHCPLVHTTRNYTLQIIDTHRLVSSVYYSLH